MKILPQVVNQLSWGIHLPGRQAPRILGGGHPSIVLTTLQTKLVASSSYREEGYIHKALFILKNAIKQQNKVINTLLESIDQLLFIRDKSKSNTIINAIDQVAESAKARDQSQTAFTAPSTRQRRRLSEASTAIRM